MHQYSGVKDCESVTVIPMCRSLTELANDPAMLTAPSKVRVEVVIARHGDGGVDRAAVVPVVVLCIAEASCRQRACESFLPHGIDGGTQAAPAALAPSIMSPKKRR